MSKSLKLKIYFLTLFALYPGVTKLGWSALTEENILVVKLRFADSEAFPTSWTDARFKTLVEGAINPPLFAISNKQYKVKVTVLPQVLTLARKSGVDSTGNARTFWNDVWYPNIPSTSNSTDQFGESVQKQLDTMGLRIGLFQTVLTLVPTSPVPPKAGAWASLGRSTVRVNGAALSMGVLSVPFFGEKSIARVGDLFNPAEFKRSKPDSCQKYAADYNLFHLTLLHEYSHTLGCSHTTMASDLILGKLNFTNDYQNSLDVMGSGKRDCQLSIYDRARLGWLETRYTKEIPLEQMNKKIRFALFDPLRKDRSGSGPEMIRLTLGLQDYSAFFKFDYSSYKDKPVKGNTSLFLEYRAGKGLLVQRQIEKFPSFVEYIQSGLPTEDVGSSLLQSGIIYRDPLLRFSIRVLSEVKDMGLLFGEIVP